MEEMSKMEKKNMELIATATSTSEDDQGPSLRSESSSSIGQHDDDDDDEEEEEEEVQSTLSSLASLEDSLPIKRGLSKFYVGKSKSYGNLGEVRSLEDVGKSDNPFSKRRRTLLAYNLMFRDHHNSTIIHNNNICRSNSKSKAALFYAHSTHISMPLLPLSEDHDDDDNDNDNDDNGVELDDDYCAAPTTSTSSSSFQFLPSTPPVNATASAAVTPPSSHHTNTNITNANTHTSLV